jgi:protein dithiol:quinone oxidoreductase
MKRLFRLGHVVIFLITLGVLLTSYYLQYADELQPCPLCLMQRGMTFGILFFALLGIFFHARKGRCGMAWGVFVFALGGIFFASRQLWLQALPPAETGMCLPGVEMLIHRLPWHEVVHAFVWGSSSGCGEVSWTFVHLSMAAWSALYFALMGVMSLFLMIKCYRYDRF